MSDTTNVANIAQLGVIVVVAVWSIAKVSNTTNVLKALVERMEKQMVRLQNEHSRIDRRLAKLEVKANVWDRESPSGDKDGE